MKNKVKNIKDKVDWIFHYVGGGCQCKDCQETDDGVVNIHTHGINKHNHPELMISLPLNPNVGGAILNSLGLRILDGERFDKEGIYTNIIQGDLRVELKKVVVDGEENMLIILPDANGKLPNEQGCEDIYANQIEFFNIYKESFNKLKNEVKH